MVHIQHQGIFIAGIGPATGQGLQQFFQPQGFEQTIVHACRFAAAAFLFLSVGRQADQAACRPATAPLMLANRSGQGMAIEPRHVAVTDHHVEVFL